MGRFSQISVSSEPSLQIVKSHFKQISGSQWVMLARGMCDLETVRILTSMFISLVQKLSANVLGLIAPRREVNNRILNRGKSTRAYGTIITVLQNTMGQVFSQALNLPTDSLDKHQDSQELTSLIEQEVSTKVNRVLSEKQEEGPVVVDALISSKSVARSMIDKGKSCLMSFLRFAKKNLRNMQENLEKELLVEELEPETRSLSRESSCGKTPGHALRTLEILNRLALAASPNAEIRTEFQNQDPEQTNTRKTGVKGKLRHHDLKRTYATVRNEVLDYLQTLQNYIAQDPLENFYLQDLFELCIEKPPLSPNSQQALTYNVSIPYQGSVPVQVDFQQLSEQSFNSQKHDIFERSMAHPRACVPSQTSRDVPEIVTLTPEVSTRRISGNSENCLRIQKNGLLERSMVPPKVERPSFISEDVQAVVLKTPEGMRRISDRDLSEDQSMTRGLIEVLMIEMFRATLRPWEKNYKVIRDRLTEMVWEEIQLCEHQTKKTKKGMNKIIDAIVKDLISHYGTELGMLESALDNIDGSFDKTVLKSLQYHIEHNLRKTSFLCRMFRFLCKPFECCCCCFCCCRTIDD
uniref:Uncharacterized protein n=1 Tax=Knipowitschia caucasica TaxID=637954 RepID=A0AAV2JD63_KNICA